MFEVIIQTYFLLIIVIRRNQVNNHPSFRDENPRPGVFSFPGPDSSLTHSPHWPLPLVVWVVFPAPVSLTTISIWLSWTT